jgi:uncharacterized protein (UPF0548 family)
LWVFLLRRPTPAQIDSFIAAQRDARFSYVEVGATRAGRAPVGFNVDHNRIQVGFGAETFHRAGTALRRWRMSTLGWTSIHAPSAQPAVGQTVAVVVGHYGFWSMNACRVVYVVDEEDGTVRRTGFAYGTLPAHGEIGEERFTIEWHREDDSVWYDLYAFSRPGHLLAKLGYPLARRLQRRFADESKQVMLSAVRSATPDEH